MRSHIKHGYSHEDVIEFSWQRSSRKRSAHTAPIFMHLGHARFYAWLSAQPPVAGGTCRRENRLGAFEHLRKAREYRLEIAAH